MDEKSGGARLITGAPPSHCPSLNSRVAELDRFDSRIPLDSLLHWIASLELSSDCLADHLRFDPRHYCRNCVRTGPAYEAQLLCWRPGQSSPIHDHRGSSCVFRILQGIATETMFESRGSLAHPVDRRILATGSVRGSLEDDIHELANCESTDLVSLHVYSPALTPMRTYGLLPQRHRTAAA